MQLTSNISIYDGQHLYHHDQREIGDCLYGQHPHICWNKRRTYMDYKNGTGEIIRKKLVLESQEMWILQDEDQISRHDHQRRKNLYGPCQTWRNKRLANPHHAETSMIFLGIWKQKVYISLFQSCSTPWQPDKEGQEIWMDHQMSRSIWHLETMIHWRTSTINAWPVKTIPNWIRHVKSGNRSSTHSIGLKWQLTSCSIHVKNVHRYWMKIQDLQQRTPWNHLSLERIKTLYLRIWTYHCHILWSQKPDIFQNSPETE